MKNKLFLIGLIIFYIAVVFGVCVFKYANNLYNGADLGIFYQAFQSLTQGDFLFVPIQGTQYFADHFSLMFFIFCSFFYLCRSPLFLLFLQTLFIALAAWPLYLIARKHLSNKKSFLMVAAYLFNPFIIGMNLFEFHFLPVCFLFAFWMYYFYDSLQRNEVDSERWKYWLGFYTFMLLCLFVREDVGLFVFGFGLFILFEKSKKAGFKKAVKSHEVISCLCLSAAWSLAGWFVIGHFNEAPNKFLIYFDWMRSWEGILNHIFNFKQFELLLQIFLPFAFLSLFKIRFYIMSFFYYLLLAGTFGAGVLKGQYGALIFIPGFIATIFALKEFEIKKFKNPVIDLYAKIAPAVLLVLIIYLNVVMGPWQNLIFFDKRASDKTGKFAEQTKNSVVAAPFHLYAKLSPKNTLYSFEKVYYGRRQFSYYEYKVENLDYLIVDQTEFVVFLLYHKYFRSMNQLPSNLNNIRKSIKENNLVFAGNLNKYNLLYEKQGLKSDFAENSGDSTKSFDLNEYFENWENNVLRINYYKNDSVVKRDFIVPFINEIQPDKNFDKTGVTLVDVEGFLTLNNLMVAENKILNVEELSEEKFIE